MTTPTGDGRPLSGHQVLEVGGTLPVAAAAKLFSDYGAEVTKVEPLGGARMRRIGPFPGDLPSLETGAFHVALDTGKRSLVVDLEVPSGRAVLDRLCATADLVLLHLPPAAARDVQESIRAMDPRPALVVLAEHGLHGPYADRTDNGTSLFALTGRMRQHSIPGEEPLRYAPYVPEMQWAATAAAVAIASVWGRNRGGPAREAEVSAVEAMTGNVDNWFLIWEFQGGESPRAAGQSRNAYPAGCYRCADGYVVFAASNPPFFGRLCEGIGRPELSADPRFTDPVTRGEHFGEFFAILDPWLRARPRQEVFTHLQSYGVMVAPVLDASEVVTDPQAVARQSFVEHPLPTGGSTTIASAPFRLEGAWQARPAPRLGEHTDAVLRELDYSTTERLALFRAGVTG